MTIFQPMILGSGQAGKAIASACRLLSGTRRWQDKLAQAMFLDRQTPLNRASLAQYTSCEPLLMLANPQGLHASSMLEALSGGIKHICIEKPAAVRLEELPKLEAIAEPIAVFHGYRQLWGVRQLQKLIVDGRLGDIFMLEVRYWQSSAAQRAINKSAAIPSWKNDPNLLGPHDTYLDLGCHAVDLAQYLLSEPSLKWQTQLHFVNAEAAHRDTHALLDSQSKNGASVRLCVSKTMHGFGNELELTVAGSMGTAIWRFQNPDHLIIGHGSTQTIHYRSKNEPEVSEFPPGHGLGWLEGYVATIEGYLSWVKQGLKPPQLPSLQEHLTAIRGL